jgi:hypothetical protein
VVFALLQEEHLILRMTQWPLRARHFPANDFRDLSHSLAVQGISGRSRGDVAEQRHFSPQPGVISPLDIVRNKPMQELEENHGANGEGKRAP